MTAHDRKRTNWYLCTLNLVYLSGQRDEVGAEHAGTMLADYLRYVRGLTGTKIVCAEGGCGACTVLRWFPLGKAPGEPSYVAVNSCILTMAQLDGSSLVTVDALRQSGLSPVQTAMIKCHGSIPAVSARGQGRDPFRLVTISHVRCRGEYSI